MKSLLVLLALTLSACPSVFSGQASEVNIQPHGRAGTTVILDMGGVEVCRVTGTASSLHVHTSVARRICAAHPLCKWGPE